MTARIVLPSALSRPISIAHSSPYFISFSRYELHLLATLILFCIVVRSLVASLLYHIRRPLLSRQNIKSMAQPAASSDAIDIDSIIARLLEVRGNRPGKQVNLTEAEIRGMCIKSREIFISQPILLELEAPIKIVGAPRVHTHSRRIRIAVTIFCPLFCV